MLRVGTLGPWCFAIGMKELIPLQLRRSLGDRYSAWRTARCQSRLLRSLRGDAVQCNVCGWKGARFTDDPWHSGTVCPSCRSQVRHRLLAAMLDGLADAPGLSEMDLLAGREVLHFAPERQLRGRIACCARRYVTADFDRGDCDLKLDMSGMPSVVDASFDMLIACDVLEHVPEDRKALGEARRVLRRGGNAIFTVPQKDSPATTDEDATVKEFAERERRFGQKDHVRIYGDDFSARLCAEGFAVQEVTSAAFSDETCRRHVLSPPQSNPHPLATNQRRIYIARAG